MSRRYLEDFTVGQTFGSGRLRSGANQGFRHRIRSPAIPSRRERGAEFGLPRVGSKRLAYAALTMRLLVDSEIEPAGGIVGVGFDEFRWPRPVRPGDELHIESEVLEVRPSKSRSNQGLIKVRTTTLNQKDEAVQIQIANLIVPRRQAER